MFITLLHQSIVSLLLNTKTLNMMILLAIISNSTT